MVYLRYITINTLRKEDDNYDNNNNNNNNLEKNKFHNILTGKHNDKTHSHE
jgi:hypothetical protein